MPLNDGTSGQASQRHTPRSGSAIALSLVVVAMTPTTAGHAAEAYPTRPVRMIVPFAPGGGTDIAARVIADALSQALGQPVVTENRGGAGSTIGTDIAAKATPDGHTLLLGNISLAFNAGLYPKLPYNALRDLAPISLVVDQPNIMVAHPSLPAQNLKEFLALARAQPGKLTYGSAGVGAGTHLAMELLMMSFNLKLTHVPYKGTGPALTAILGNEISAFLSTYASALPHVKAGRLKTFGVSSTKRAATLPDAPTMSEAGAQGFEYSTWYGLLAPAATPRAILQKLNAVTVSALNSTDVQKRYISQGMDPVPTSAQEFGAKLKSDTDKWTRVVKAANVTIDQ